MNLNRAIKIEVNARYLQDQSDPAAERYAFAYSVEITNQGTETVKLLNRYWRITDDNNKVEEVRGEGVIGQQPVIHPGQTFHYTSGAIIETEFGTMQGSYEMLASNGETFEATIPPFLLSLPDTVH
ncbi:MAG: Co2+/Mg2+ efflux protein ApaG [Proteobacteria bacterium]|nr:Co2+/Mg2+ efflux protein ApaG [Pseudomonadota bacterium]